MQGKFKDLTGKRFGKLTVIARIHSKTNIKVKWLCVCECGNLTESWGYNLRRGKSTQCKTCSNREKATKHGFKGTRLYDIWHIMKQRCNNSNRADYQNYGGRGITVCDEWNLDYMNFHTWAMNNGYKDDLSIDRINVDGNYCPHNCRWVDMKTQARNRRNNKQIIYKGITKTLADWCEDLGLRYGTIQWRLSSGWSVEKAFETPIQRRDK